MSEVDDELLTRLETVWDQLVGPKVAQNSRPTEIADGTLTITTQSNAWTRQLSFLSDHLLGAVTARLPNIGVRAIRLRVGDKD